MNFIVSSILGGVFGSLAGLLMPHKVRLGPVVSMSVGALASGLGAWLAAARGITPPGSILQIVVGGVTAALLIYLLATLGLFRN